MNGSRKIGVPWHSFRMKWLPEFHHLITGQTIRELGSGDKNPVLETGSMFLSSRIAAAEQNSSDGQEKKIRP